MENLHKPNFISFSNPDVGEKITYSGKFFFKCLKIRKEKIYFPKNSSENNIEIQKIYLFYGDKCI